MARLPCQTFDGDLEKGPTEDELFFSFFTVTDVGGCSHQTRANTHRHTHHENTHTHTLTHFNLRKTEHGVTHTAAAGRGFDTESGIPNRFKGKNEPTRERVV